MDVIYSIGRYVGGKVCVEEDGYSIIIRTSDNTSKENYDDLLDISNDIQTKFPEVDIKELWADHDTQIIEFE